MNLDERLSLARILCLLFFAVASLVGCRQAESVDPLPASLAASSVASAASAAVVAYEAVPEAKRKRLLGLSAYNYTDLPISSYSVNHVWGGDVRVSSETSGGSKTSCCIKVPPVLPATYLVRWSRDDRRWCELKVAFGGPIPEEPSSFNTHFFADGHVEITIADLQHFTI